MRPCVNDISSRLLDEFIYSQSHAYTFLSRWWMNNGRGRSSRALYVPKIPIPIAPIPYKSKLPIRKTFSAYSFIYESVKIINKQSQFQYGGKSVNYTDFAIYLTGFSYTEIFIVHQWFFTDSEWESTIFSNFKQSQSWKMIATTKVMFIRVGREKNRTSDFD